MSRDIKNELQTLYNELEGEYVALRNALFGNRDEASDYLNGRKISSKMRTLILNCQTLDNFIERAHRESIDASRVVEIIFAHRYGRNLTKRQIVIEALRATEDIRYVELADKLDMFGNEFTNSKYSKEKVRQAILLVKMVAEGKISYPYDPAEAKTVVEDRKGKKRTVKSELSYISKGVKRESRKNTALANKYKNIANVDYEMNDIFRAVISFFREHDCYMPSDITNSYSNDWVRKGVVKNRYAFIDMLGDLDELKFMHTQSHGKIR